jgi:hypothetical protein
LKPEELENLKINLSFLILIIQGILLFITGESFGEIFHIIFLIGITINFFYWSGLSDKAHYRDIIKEVLKQSKDK